MIKGSQCLEQNWSVEHPIKSSIKSIRRHTNVTSALIISTIIVFDVLWGKQWKAVTLKDKDRCHTC